MSVIDTQSILDEHKDSMPEGVYLALSNSLLKAYEDRKLEEEVADDIYEKLDEKYDELKDAAKNILEAKEMDKKRYFTVFDENLKLTKKLLNKKTSC